MSKKKLSSAWPEPSVLNYVTQDEQVVLRALEASPVAQPAMQEIRVCPWVKKIPWSRT